MAQIWIGVDNTWTKGSRAWEVPIRNDEQRQVLNEAKVLAGAGSLIPASMTYVGSRSVSECRTTGLAPRRRQA